MKRCFGYIRVSTLKQGEGVSLEAQQEAIQAFASRNKIIISQWFEEKETAAKRGRPVFNAMTAELRKGKADGVVFHKIDRSTRNHSDWAKIGELADEGINIHFATESLDFTSRGGRLTADIQAVIAADYIRNLREEAIKGMEGRLKQGLYPFGAPFGYNDNGRGKPKTIDPVHGETVKRLFELYATGSFSLHALAKASGELGLLNKGGKPLPKTSIEKILRNPFYVGIMQVKRTGKSYKGIHEPIISPELFDRVEAIRTNRDNKKKTKHNHLFGGLFRCARCKRAMIPEKQKGRVYYRCHNKACPRNSIREDAIGKAIEDFLSTRELSEREVQWLKTSYSKQLEDDDLKQAQHVANFELPKLEQRMERLAEKLVDDVIDSETFQALRSKMLREQTRLNAIVSKAEASRAKTGHLDGFLNRSKNLLFQYKSGDREEKRALLELVTSTREIIDRKVQLELSAISMRLDQFLDEVSVSHSVDETTVRQVQQDPRTEGPNHNHSR